MIRLILEQVRVVIVPVHVLRIDVVQLAVQGLRAWAEGSLDSPPIRNRMHGFLMQS